MIRELTIPELPLLFPIGEHFFREANLPGTFVPEVFIRSWQNLLQLKMGAIFGAFDPDNNLTGALGCLLFPDLNDGKICSIEAFWYVFSQERGHGIRLVRAYEQWARNHNVARIAMVHLLTGNAGQLKKLYERLGYRALETTCVKELA